jgi:N,N-dimethylformamidase beta subunit-like protein/uncharacterized protein DUF4082/Big-like domain-containing protein
MTRLLQRLIKRHANAIGVLTGLAIVISILLAAERNLLNTTYIAATVGANPSSMSATAQGDPFAPCVPAAANAIACENSKAGTPSGAWDVAGAGSANIQGFATNISVNRGETVRFKIDTNSNNYRLDIYRLGYYGGLGARFITTVQPSAALPQSQPSCLTQPSTGLIDCGNWAESASWAVPSNATSGIYIARLVREDATSGESHIVFVVRDDSGASDLLFQTSDTTWQAYNSYGGNSLYTGSPDGRAYKVSYNRPFNTRAGVTSQDWLFDGEYPMVRWLEANGYNVSYSTGVDTDRRGAELLEHRAFLSVGHDEYWSGTQRANVEAARNAGVHLAFFSGNTMFWKTRWENSIDGSGTQFRTLVCYKETHANAKIDPLANVWTGTWRDPRFSPPADGGRPENALTGTLFMVNDPAEDAIKVPEAVGKFRLWRGTTVATQTPGQTATVGPITVGYEWDEDLNNGSRPSGLIRLSTNTVNVSSYLQDLGSTYAPGTATHSLTLYRHSSGALVFSAASIRWSWGLDNNHDQGGASSIPPPDVRMRQATVNLLADMGVQPATLQPGLTPASQSTDTLAAASTITSPSAGANVVIGTTVNITGTANDSGGGLVAGVNVSVDGGSAWSAATGTNAWSYSWTPTALGPATIRSRAIDDSGNAQTTPTQINVTVISPPAPTCPCSVWAGSATPANPLENDGDAVELGLKFRSDTNGFISGVRFYKGGAANGGTHVGHLWTSAGALLGTANFASETASGWQQALFQNPIPVTANTTYVVSYFAPQGHYAADGNFFASSGVDNAPLHALSNAAAGGNGVYQYGPTGGFPSNSYQSSNYWVDVVFTTTAPGPDTTPPTVTSFTPASGATNVNVDANVTVTFNEPMNATTVNGTTVELRDPSNALVSSAVSYDAGSLTATLNPTASLAAGTTYTARVKGGSTDPRVKDVAGNALAANLTWTFTTAVVTPPPTCPCSVWASSATPANPLENDGDAVELGLKFRSDRDGVITGVRFYKGGATNGGTHVGHLWTSAGALLGTVNFASETASGWQQALFQNPIPVTANTTYVVSYFAPQGHYAADGNFFASSGVDNGPLHALSNGFANGNGVFHYGPTGGFPSDSFQSANYWVDVVFNDSGPFAPQVLSVTPEAGATGVSTTVAPSAVFSEPLDATSLTSSTVMLRNAANNLVSATISYSPSDFTVTLTPQQPLQPQQTYTVTLKGGSATPHITDATGTPLASNFTWSFTTAAPPPPVTTFSIWAPTATPANPLINDGDAVELGLKFRSDRDGVITGVRFYKGGSTNGGTHVGHLWTSAGALLGTVNFANETTSGWQQALFDNPIPVTANTTYVVSYFAPQGHYAADANYFASSGVDNGPLHALSASFAGGNGVYHYSPTGGFPTDTFQSSNYWVDVVFVDPGPPQVVSVNPAAGATGVSTDVAPSAVFSEPLDATSLSASTVMLRDASNNLVTAAVSYSASDFKVTLTPQQLLQSGQTYTVTLKGGSATPHITDASGTPLASDFTWSFTTAPLPSPLPILVITRSGNKFTQYYQEILRAEGFNNFNAIDMLNVTEAALAQYDVAILGEMPLTASQVTMLNNWVGSGGNLIAMRPDKQLASLLGISDAASVRSDAYLLVNTSQAPGAGIVNQTIQYHGAADLYTLSGATQVATIYSGPSQATSNPAVTLRSVGTNGGQAAAFTFDLARSIVFTRQGNPAWAGQERDGIAPIRPNDLFFPDYVNLDKAAIPQADELQRLLGNMILSMNMDRRPLPRFWYLPNMKKAVIMMTGDDHGTPEGTKSTFDTLIAESAPGCSVANWGCYRATSWLYTESGLTNSQALTYQNQGFEMGVHVNTNCANWTPLTLDNFFATDLSSFAAKYTNLPAQKTNRTHCIAWSDWATQPKVEFNHGIRLDETYYYWPASWVQNRPGFMTGSGFPMRYADLDGAVIDVYQAPTHLVNENGITYPEGINTMLDKALGPEGYYGVFGTHYDYSDSFDAQLLNSAKARNVSMISAQQLLTWLDGRNSSSFGNPTWNGTQLGFSITVGAGANNLFAMVPNQIPGRHLGSLTINGSTVSFTVETIKGRSYAVFRAANGNAVATYVP